MNNTQRQFLIKKIEEGVKNTIKALEDCKPIPPSLSNYILHAVMSGKFEIISNDKIKGLIKAMALQSKERDDWMGNSWGTTRKDKITFDVKEFFVLPPEYSDLYKEYREKTNSLNEQISTIRIQSDTLITRIQLASDKTLQAMINEVDDMGNISLMDTKLKLLTNG